MTLEEVIEYQFQLEMNRIQPCQFIQAINEDMMVENRRHVLPLSVKELPTIEKYLGLSRKMLLKRRTGLSQDVPF